MKMLRLSVFAVFLVFSQAKTCDDGIDNILVGVTTDPDEDNSIEPYDVQIHNLTFLTYDNFRKPACFLDKPSIRLPGQLKLISGIIEIPEDYDLDFAYIKLTSKKGGVFYCKHGKTHHPMIVTNEMCTYLVSDLLSPELVELFSKAGTYDIAELMEEKKMKTWIALSETPSMLGISTYDLIKGTYQLFAELVIGDTVLTKMVIGGEDVVDLLEIDKKPRVIIGL